jgi:SAM-dependent methyltransferase
MPAGSRNRWPEDYERGRPGWPSNVVELAGLPPASRVLDLGAGTGKLTRLLAAAFDTVVAVEPADAMRRILAAHCAQVQTLAGTAHEISLHAESVDAVFAGQAFHWFADEPAVAEISRVLQPSGALVVMWNLPGGATRPSIAAVERLLTERGPTAEEFGSDPLDLGGPRYVSGDWARALAESPFEPLRAARLTNPQTLDREGMVAFFASMGWLADLPDAERLSLLDEVRSLLTADEYRRPWDTYAYWTRLSRSS